ncbi:MAG TPA: multidrug effflux MFS transporter [Stellaceae bacterium]|nr:multidrug effflux MFS transporter [Stellaceae bacterium]
MADVDRPSAAQRPLAPARFEPLFFLLAALTGFAPLTTDIYVPAMPAMQQAFATSAAAVQLTLSTYFVGYALGQLFYGPVADHFGRKPPLYVGMALFIVASVACGLAPTVGWIAGARFIQAIGACAGSVIARAVVADLFEAQQAARVFAMLTMVMGVAPIVAPSAGAYLLAWFGWEAIFWALAAFGVACLVLSWLKLPETLNADHVAPLALGDALKRYVEIATDRRFLGYCLPGAFGMGGMFAYIAGSAFVFIGHYHFTATGYGLLFGLNSCGIICGAQVNRFLLRRYRAETLLRRALMVQLGVALILLGAALSGPTRAAVIAVPLWCYLATIGFVFPNAMAMAMSAFRHRAGSASATLGAIQSALASLTAIIVGAIGSATVVPMALVIAGYGVLAVAASRWIDA